MNENVCSFYVKSSSKPKPKRNIRILLRNVLNKAWWYTYVLESPQTKMKRTLPCEIYFLPCIGHIILHTSSQLSKQHTMPTRNGTTFTNPPVSARELRRRRQAAQRAAALPAASPEHSHAIVPPVLVPPVLVPPVIVQAPSPIQAPAVIQPVVAAVVAALPSIEAQSNPSLHTNKKKKKKKKKKKAARKIVKRFPYGIETGLVKSFDDWFEACCLIDTTKTTTQAPGLLKVGDVQKEYRAWCVTHNRPYCPERTSKIWNVAPFVVNDKKIDRLPPFRLLLFHKTGRIPNSTKGVFSSTETAWRRHKKTYKGHPYYQRLGWKPSFTPSIKYNRRSSK